MFTFIIITLNGKLRIFAKKITQYNLGTDLQTLKMMERNL